MELLTTMPGYKLYEYLLILQPCETMYEHISAFKLDFYKKYRAESAKFGKPHLTLARFLQYRMGEQRLFNKLNTAASHIKPIAVELKNFGSFPSHTIYMNVGSKTPVQNLVKSIRTQAGPLMKIDNKYAPHFILEPHISIARNLQPWQYEQGWFEYSQRQFSGKFLAKEMLLLRRASGEMKFEKVENFSFCGTPVAAEQGSLFA